MSTPDYNDEASAKKASADTYAAETAALPKTDYADNPTNMQYAAPPESFASGAAPAAAAVQGTQKRSNKVVLLAAGVALACGLAEAQSEGRSIQQLRVQLQAMGCRAAVQEVLRTECSRGREAQDLTAARAATVRRGIPRTAQVHRAVQTQARRGIQPPMGHRV